MSNGGDDHAGRPIHEETTYPRGASMEAEVTKTGVSLPERVSYWSLPNKRQLAILMLARLTETMTTSSIHAYVYFQLRRFDPTASSATISTRVGLIFSAKTAAHSCTGILWGRLADSQYGGRKAVLVFGLINTSIALLGYGFSQSFAAALAWQMVDGALNATLSMVRCMTAELNPEKGHRARALALLPLFSNGGSLLGPLIGGLLVPINATNNRFPYARPNIVIAIVHLLVAIAIVFGLEETLPDVQSPYKTCFRKLRKSSKAKNRHSTLGSIVGPAESVLGESEPLLGNNARNEPFETAIPDTTDLSTEDGRYGRYPFRMIWTFNVVTTMLAQFIIAGHIGTFPTLWAIFLSVPSEDPSPERSPFRSHGGIGLSSRSVGIAMSLLGALGVAMQAALYPMLNDRLGTMYLWRSALLMFPVAYVLAPFCSLVNWFQDSTSEALVQDGSARVLVWAYITLILLLYLAGRVGVTPATSLLINDCTPHRSARATIHTVGTVVTNLSRTIFPVAALSIFGLGLHVGVVGLGFWFTAGLAILSCVASSWVVEGNNGESTAQSQYPGTESNSRDSGRH